MGFHETDFPNDIAYGSRGGPGFRTEIIITDSGAEERTSRWVNMHHQYDVAYGIKSHDQWAIIKKFFAARVGAANGFRFKDVADFTTASNGRDANTNADHSIGTGDASTTTFQLVKRYTEGGSSHVRTLTKIVTGSVKIAFDTVDQPTGWTVNTATGLITFSSAPGNGVAITAGCDFVIPVRFTETAEQWLAASYEDFSTSSGAIELVEISDTAILPEDFFYGGGQTNAVMAADISISHLSGRVVSLTPTAARNIDLPLKAGVPTGGPHFYIKNKSGSFVLTLRDGDTQATVTTIAVNKGAIIVLADNAGTKTWEAFTEV